MIFLVCGLLFIFFLSFDEQVALLRDNDGESDIKNKTKVLKLDNSNDIDNKVA